MDDQTFKLFMARFEKIDADNKAQLELLRKHVDDDYKVHQVVQRHATYFKFLFMGLPVLGSAFAVKMGWK